VYSKQLWLHLFDTVTSISNLENNIPALQQPVKVFTWSK